MSQVNVKLLRFVLSHSMERSLARGTNGIDFC